MFQINMLIVLHEKYNCLIQYILLVLFILINLVIEEHLEECLISLLHLSCVKICGARPCASPPSHTVSYFPRVSFAP
jgi:hypothetical protein